jgi:polar amino acid transport system substrate-binding protein
LAFSTPYLTDDAGAVLAAGDELTDLKTAREQRWAVQSDTVEEDLLVDTIRPDTPPVRFSDAVACVDAVANAEVDAALVDLSTALILTNDRDDVTTGARFVLDEAIAIAMPPDSPNVEVVDAGINALDADGTLDELAETWLRPVFDTDPESIPVVRTP